MEALFSIITRQALRRGSLPTVADLIAAIERFIAARNDRWQPFTWTKDLTVIVEETRSSAAQGTTDVRYRALAFAMQ